jgi:pimeloyl-ACP methyl ester carboxylesterase
MEECVRVRLAFLLLATPLLFAQAPPVPPRYQLAAEERSQIEARIRELKAKLEPLRAKTPDELYVDVEVYLKAAQWALRYEEFYNKRSVEQTLAVLDTGLERARQLAAGDPAWTRQKGSFSRAYRSRVDGSIQPYAVTIPENYSEKNNPEWLDVVLHGRGATLNEVSFLYSHDRRKPPYADHQFIQLDVFGRANVAYRWAGETDVFEALDSVRKRYKIDDGRIALRGFSMGGAGAWHMGLHYPDKWAAVEAGAGFVETKVHAKIPDPPRYAHIYDALDYALNAVNGQFAGYGGEDDPQLRASVFVRKELEREGYKFIPDGLNFKADEPLRALFLIGPKTEHKWHPDSKKESDSFILLGQSRGIGRWGQTRFVTYTERYNKCFDFTVDQLERQYERASVDQEYDDFAVKLTTKNVARLTIHGEPPANRFLIDDQSFPIAPSLTVERAGGRWRRARPSAALTKSHGLQGPIDDAFMDSFLCVRSAGDDFTNNVLDRFQTEFAQWMRGDIRVKSESELKPADIRRHHIVAFGTPATSPLVAGAVAASPIQWTSSKILVGKQSFDARTHRLSMIYPNPANPKRYIVINSGHTFHEADFKGTNALLYPRVGDWAVTNIETGNVVAEGTFGMNWK